jgi:hypothetical protein
VAFRYAADIRVAMRRAHLSPEDVRAVVKLLEGERSRSGHAVTLIDLEKTR